MFTIRTEINGTVKLSKRDEFTFHKYGSSGFDDAMRLIDEVQKGDDGEPLSVDFISYQSPTFAETKADSAIIDEGYTVAVWRDDVGVEPIGVVEIDTPPDDEEGFSLGEALYQFIYPGDSVYVTNSAGATVETVK